MPRDILRPRLPSWIFSSANDKYIGKARTFFQPLFASSLASESRDRQTTEGKTVDALLIRQLVSLTPSRIRDTRYSNLSPYVCVPHYTQHVPRTRIYTAGIVLRASRVYTRGYVPRSDPETESGYASSNGTLVYRLTVVRHAGDTCARMCSFDPVVLSRSEEESSLI